MGLLRPFQAQGCVPPSVEAAFRLVALLRLVAVLHLAAPLRRGVAFLLVAVLHLAAPLRRGAAFLLAALLLLTRGMHLNPPGWLILVTNQYVRGRRGMEANERPAMDNEDARAMENGCSEWMQPWKWKKGGRMNNGPWKTMMQQ